MSKHTPGPWFISETGPKWSINVGNGGASNRHIAMVSCYQEFTNDHTENLANARLIAAAPELEDTLWAMVNAARKLSVLHNDSDFDEVDYAHDLYEEAEQMFHNVINKIKG